MIEEIWILMTHLFGLKQSRPACISLVLILLTMACPCSFAEDCNRNGVEDEQDIAAETSADCDSDGVPDECQLFPVDFSSRGLGVTVSRYPRAVICVDVDSDGILDIVTANKDGDTRSMVTVLKNDGSGIFERADFEDAVRASDLDAADFDGDGANDLLTANYYTLELLWNDGTGSFEERESIAVERGTRHAAAGDFNGDGLADIVSTNDRSNRAWVYINAGERSFSEPVAYGVGSVPSVVRVVDIEGDGDLDICTVNVGSGTITILQNDGNGGFGSVRTVSTGLTSPVHLAVADFDLDGSADFAVASDDNIAILYGGDFSESEVFVANAGELVVADLDGDGDTDIGYSILANRRIAILLNVSGSFFSQPVEFAVDIEAGLLAAGDLDNDNDLDLITAYERHTRVPILWNNDESGITVESRTLSMAPAPHAMVMDDLNGDGYLDIATGDGLGSTITIFLNDGAGNFRPGGNRTVQAGDYLNSIDGGDFDGDGDIDLVTAAIQDRRMQVFLNNGQGAYGSRALYTTGVRPFMVEVGELTGDGFPEIASANETAGTVTVYLNSGTGNGRFAGRREYRVGRLPVAVAMGDLDGDGDQDVISANRGSRDLSVLMNSGNGTLGAAVSYTVDGTPWYVVTADFDADGDIDLATANQPNRTVGIFYNRGDGTFEAGVNFDSAHGPYSMVVYDLNIDGVPDILTANQSADSVSALINRGDGTFNPAVTYNAGNAPRFVQAGDLDLDGDVDFVAADHDGRTLTVFRNQAPVESRDTHREVICTEVDYYDMSTPSRRGRDLKFVIPSDPGDASRLPPLFQNGRLFDLHQDFLTAVFPDRFPLLGPVEYNRLVGLRETRQYYIGSVTRIAAPTGTVYGFSVFTDISQSASQMLTLEEVRGIYNTLRSSFGLELLAYVPGTIPAREAAVEWEDPGFPVYLDVAGSSGNYESYTEAVGYGTVRILTEEAFEAANDNGGLSFRDILILPHAPRDIEGVVAGVITGMLQGPLSHLAIRTARRGSPNAFVEGAISAFTPLDGILVRLEVSGSEYEIRPASFQEAEKFWAANQINLGNPPQPDETFGGLTSLAEFDLAAEAATLVGRYGGKGVNMARLQSIMTGEFSQYGEVGFVVPTRYYLEFTRSNRLFSAVQTLQIVTYEEYIEELLGTDRFRSDSEYRFEMLDRLRDHMDDNSTVDPELVTSIARRIGEVFGETTSRVRFRSSSNVEDALEFNGAGLYDSTSGCAADDLDDDNSGPSRCDSENASERGVARALRKVWQSVWNFRAFEEREFFGIPQQEVAMGILVSRAYADERANGVIFTGNPSNPLDDRYLVTSQVGDSSVVSPEPGVLAAQDLLVVDQGQVLEISRSSSSSLLPQGQNVLSDAELRELGNIIWHIESELPIDLDGHDASEVVYDIEYKVESNGELAVKQVRPFLRNAQLPPTPSFRLQIAANTSACVGFGNSSIQRGAEQVLDLKSKVRLRQGEHVLPSSSLITPLELIEEVRFGPAGARLQPVGPGMLRASRIEDRNGTTRHRFIFDQVFAIDDELRLKLRLFLLEPFTARGAEAVREVLVFNELYVEDTMTLQGEITSIADPDVRLFIDYSSCRYDSLDLWEVSSELEDGTTISILENYRPPDENDEFGPIRLRSADVRIRGQRRRVTSYWKLVYSASRHNTFVRHWVVLDPPLQVAGLDRPVAVMDLVAQQLNSEGTVLQEPLGRYLDANFEELGRSGVTSYTLERFTDPLPILFQRGDVDLDGSLSITDSINLLVFLFAEGELPGCLDAGDADDSGDLNITDAVTSLGYLFRGGEALPAPFLECGVDSTDDELGCEAEPVCP